MWNTFILSFYFFCSCWFPPLLREVFLRVLRFSPLLKKPTFPNSNSTRNQVDEEPLCGCSTCKSLFIYLFILFIWIQTFRIFYFSRRLFAKHHTLSSWCRILSSRYRAKFGFFSISKFFLFIVVIVISILPKTAFWQTSIHSQQSLVKML